MELRDRKATTGSLCVLTTLLLIIWLVLTTWDWGDWG